MITTCILSLYKQYANYVKDHNLCWVMHTIVIHMAAFCYKYGFLWQTFSSTVLQLMFSQMHHIKHVHVWIYTVATMTYNVQRNITLSSLWWFRFLQHKKTTLIHIHARVYMYTHLGVGTRLFAINSYVKCTDMDLLVFTC